MGLTPDQLASYGFCTPKTRRARSGRTPAAANDQSTPSGIALDCWESLTKWGNMHPRPALPSLFETSLTQERVCLLI